MPSQRAPQLSDAERNYQQVLGVLMRLTDATDAWAARHLGMAPQSLQQRRKGTTRLRPHEVAQLAEAFDVPRELFDMNPLDVAKWLLDNRPDNVIGIGFGRSEQGSRPTGRSDAVTRRAQYRRQRSHATAA